MHDGGRVHAARATKELGALQQADIARAEQAIVAFGARRGDQADATPRCATTMGETPTRRATSPMRR